MSNFNEKSNEILTWEENKARITLEGRLILKRVLNKAIAEMHREYLALQEDSNTLIEFSATKEELARLLLKTAQKELGPGGDIEVEGEVTDDEV